MTRNIVIGAINLAIAAIIGINALMALTTGCSIGGGRCDGSSNMLTWVLAILMPAIVVVGGFLIFRAWRAAAPSEKREISFSLPVLPSARSAPDESDSEADNAMSARLARTTFAAHVSETADDIAEPEGAEPPDELTGADLVEAATVPAMPIAVVDADNVNAADMPDVEGFPRSEVHDFGHSPDTEALASGESVPASVDVPAVSAIHALGQWSSEPAEASSAEDVRSIDWLVDSDDAGFSPILREDSGFPWAVAGIDHVCSGVARIGNRLVGTDFPAEAAAWRQVIGGLPRHQALGADDCRAFVDWVNGILDVSGDAGLDLIEDALHELGVEAATDPLLSARLPADIADFAGQAIGDQLLRRTK